MKKVHRYKKNTTTLSKEAYTLEFNLEKFNKHFRSKSILILSVFAFYSVLVPYQTYSESDCDRITECLSNLLIPFLLIWGFGLGVQWIVKRKIINDKKDLVVTIDNKKLYINSVLFGLLDKEKNKIKKHAIFFYKKNWALNPSYETRVLIPKYFNNFEKLTNELNEIKSINEQYLS